MKVCNKCLEEKPIECFHNRGDRKRATCKECDRKKNREYYETYRERILTRNKEYRGRSLEQISENKARYYRENKEVILEKMAAKDFGITVEEVRDLRKLPCRICGTEKCKSGRAIAIDHCHETGRIRGVLCANCNTGIGLLNDSPELLRNAASYLEENQ